MYKMYKKCTKKKNVQNVQKKCTKKCTYLTLFTYLPLLFNLTNPNPNPNP